MITETGFPVVTAFRLQDERKIEMKRKARHMGSRFVSHHPLPHPRPSTHKTN